jgi:hypothetical protein
LPFTREDAVPPSRRPGVIVRALIIGLVTGGVAWLVVPGAAALVVGALVAAGLLLPWARVVATVGAVAFIVAGALNVIRGQQVHHYPTDPNWAGTFVHAGNLIWIGVVLLLADGIISAFGLRTKKPLPQRAVRAGDGGENGAPGNRNGGAETDEEKAAEPVAQT